MQPSTTILDTILTHLAALFLNGDPIAARQAAAEMLEAYHPRTDDERRLAAQIVAFSFQSLQALGQAATPDLPLTRVLRLRSGAVSLTREAEKAERRLEQLQKARREGKQIQPQPAQQAPQIEKAIDLIKDTAKVATAAKVNNQTWTQAYEERQREQRIQASIKRAEAKVAAIALAEAQARAQAAAML